MSVGTMDNSTAHLMKAFSDIQKSYEKIVQPTLENDADDVSGFQHDLQIQMDRLTRWASEWTEGNEPHSANIDDSTAGLSDVVGSVFASVQSVLLEIEQMWRPRRSLGGSEKMRDRTAIPRGLRTFDRVRFGTLLNDLKSSIETLYDISASRRAITSPKSHDIKRGSDASTTFQNSPTMLRSPVEDRGLNDFLRTHFKRKINRSTLVILEDTGKDFVEASNRISLYTRRFGYLRFGHLYSDAAKEDAEESVVPVFVEYIKPDLESSQLSYSIFSRTTDNKATSSYDPIKQKGLKSLDVIGYCIDSSSGLTKIAVVYNAPRLVENGLLQAGYNFNNALRSERHDVSIKPVACNPEALSDILTNFAPVSLLKILQSSGREHTSAMVPLLEDRFRLAYDIAWALRQSYVTASGHGDVNSNNVLFFLGPKWDISNTEVLKRSDIENACIWPPNPLVGRTTDLSMGSSDSPLDIYWHPWDPRRDGATFGESASASFQTALDLYGLGMILLELGFWMPLSAFWKTKYKAKNTAEVFKSKIENIYVKRLGSKCGTLYMKVVERCLSAANGDDSDIEETWAFVLRSLHRCCLIDVTTEDLPSPILIETPRPQSLDYPMKDIQSTSEDLTWSQSQSNHSTLIDENAVGGSSNLPNHATFERPRRSVTHRVSFKDTTIVHNSGSVAVSSQDDSPLIGRTTEPGVTNYSSLSLEHQSTGKSDTSEQHIGTTQTTTQISRQADMLPPTISSSGSKCKLRMYPVSLDKSHLNQWHKKLLPRLEKLLEQALEKSFETASVDLIGIGETSKAARPTITVTCSSVREVKAMLARRFRYDKELFDLRIRNGKINRSKSIRPRRSSAKRSAGSRAPESDKPALNPDYQVRPSCGASIGAFKNGEHLPPVSYGGVVLVDGEPYGMTVHHLLDAPSDDDSSDYGGDETPMRSSTHSGFSSNLAGIGEGHISAPDITEESYYSLEISDEEGEDDDQALFFESGDESWDSDDLDPESINSEQMDSDSESGDQDDTASEGDISGVEQGKGSNLFITQPALDDVDDNFFPSEEDRDEEHLDCHTLGHVYASSGVRRWRREGVKHEIDWALLKIKDERLQPYNFIQGGKRYCQAGALIKPPLREPVHRQFPAEEDLYPIQVANMEDLGQLRVHCFGRTSGLSGGIISPAMSSVRIVGRRTFSRSWHVMGNFGVGGDSGAWVIENGQGRICGHVLAYSSKSSLAYICPMQVLLEDIARTLGVQKVTLPGSSEVSQVLTRLPLLRKESSGPTMPNIAGLRLSASEQNRADVLVEPSVVHKDVSPSMARRRYTLRESPKVAS